MSTPFTIEIRPGDGPCLYYVGTGSAPVLYRLDAPQLSPNSMDKRERAIALALLHFTTVRIEGES